MNDIRANLLHAEQETKRLFDAVKALDLIVPGKSEKQLNDEVVKVARDVFGINEYWHKKIVKAGANTMRPYPADPPDVIIQEDDLVIMDFGPVVNGWEADVARTYVIGGNPRKQKIKADVEEAWHEANAWFNKHNRLTGGAFYQYITGLATRYGYSFGGEIAGHIVGPFPHEQLGAGNLGLDIHPDNHQDMFNTDPQGNPRHWILEIHFVDRKNNTGAFFEQLITE